MQKYKVMDLFAGAGGLSLGFQQNGKFEIVAAAENNKNAKLTYKANHPNVDVLDDVRKIDFTLLRKKYGKVDVVIGGPPCQGFSNANRQKAQAISMNNGLVKEYVRAIRELQPLVFIMENVSMLRSEVHRFYYSKKDCNIIEKLNIKLRKDELELLADVFCGDRKTELSESLSTYTDYLWSDKEYLAVNVLYRQRNNLAKLAKTAEKYSRPLITFTKQIVEGGDSADPAKHAELLMAREITRYLDQKDQPEQLISTIRPALMIQRMYKHYKELIDNAIVVDEIKTENGISANVSSFPIFEYVQKTLGSDPYNYDIYSDVLNAADFGAPQKRERYIIIGTRNGSKAMLPQGTFQDGHYRTVKDAILDLEAVKPYFNVATTPQKLDSIEIQNGTLLAYLRDSDELPNHIITETQETAMERFKALKPGQNFHCLDDELKSTYTDAKRTQNTIYLRLKYDEPSGTVVNVRKSMWVHPVLDRALSIREAARLQTFPDSFVFEGTKDAQYQQVGNAVPPILANAIAGKVAELLENTKENG